MNEKLITFSDSLDTFGFMNAGESDAEAIERARSYYQRCIDEDVAKLQRDGREAFWWSYIDEHTDKRDHVQIETWAQYEARQRAAFLIEPREITEAEWWRQYEVLPPAGLILCDSFTEFYISEAWQGTWHSGYLHDRKTGKYWAGMIDAADVSTRLAVRLGIVKVSKEG